jgi:hypothetical protein
MEWTRLRVKMSLSANNHRHPTINAKLGQSKGSTTIWSGSSDTLQLGCGESGRDRTVHFVAESVKRRSSAVNGDPEAACVADFDPHTTSQT